MRRTINLMDANITDVKGVKYSKVQMQAIVKQAADMVFVKADSFDMLDMGRDMHTLKPVKLSEQDATKVKDILRDPQKGFLFFVSAPICSYIDEVFNSPIVKAPKEKKD